ncbi:alpha/beta fold hydrolase [Candidatus Kaiserbacteria bacterium]|nr:alpha/beta fold hydrolase [Candidatus Kaiserbacteria bacterium]
MFKILRQIFVMFVAAMALVAPAALLAAPSPAEIGVVVMHGKGGGPGKYVNGLAAAFERAGFQVANLNMPWSHKRRYDVTMSGGVEEITRALDAMRAKGARKVFVAGHSQGGLFAVYYAGLHQVDGVLPIAPGGQVDAASNVANLAPYIEKAKQMVNEGRGSDKADFAEFEGAKGSIPLSTTAAIYLDWFDPNGAHTTRVFKSVKQGTPVLYVAPSRDYPGLVRSKQQLFAALPPHPKTRIYEPDSDHMGAPDVAAEEAVRWVREVAEQ